MRLLYVSPIPASCLGVLDAANSNTSVSGRPGSTSPLTAYAVLVQQSLDAAQADTELLSYLLGGGTRAVEIDHGLKILRREAITQTSRADNALSGHLRTRVAAMESSRFY